MSLRRPRERASVSQLAGRSLVGLTVIAGLAGALILGLPALSPTQSPAHAEQTEASHGR